MIELRNSKTTQIAKNSFSIDAFTGPVQIREDGGEWVDIDPTFKDGKITKAPYDLQITSTEVVFTNKITGKILKFSLSPIGVTASYSVDGNQIDLKDAQNKVGLSIIPYNTGVRFTGNLKTKITDMLKAV